MNKKTRLADNSAQTENSIPILHAEKEYKERRKKNHLAVRFAEQWKSTKSLCSFFFLFIFRWCHTTRHSKKHH